MLIAMNKRKCVCFIGRSAPNRGLESLIRREYLYYKQFAETFDQLIFLDVSKVFTSSVVSHGDVDEAAHKLLPDKFTIIIPNSLKEFKDVLKSHTMVVISCFSEEWYEWYIHHYLRKCSIPLVYIHTMSETIDFQYRKSQNSTIVGHLWTQSKVVCFKIVNRLMDYIFSAPIDTLFISNKPLARKIKHLRRYREIVITNSRFYDNYLAHSYPVTDDHIVFLDSMLPYHLDQTRFGHCLIDRDPYYFHLNRVLNVIEQKLGKKTVVCLHPKYDEANLERDFGRRQTVKYRTQEYTAQAAVVLFHESSAINNAVLYNKKVIQLTGSRFNDFTKANCVSVQKILGFPTIDMYGATQQQISDLLNVLKVDQQRYAAFLSNYIVSSGQEGVASCRQIADHIKLKYMRG